MENILDFIYREEREGIVNKLLDLKLGPQTQETKLKIQKLQQKLSSNVKKAV